MTKRHRRTLAGILILLGIVLILFAPEGLAGIVLIAIGVVVEAVGIKLEHRADQNEGS